MNLNIPKGNTKLAYALGMLVIGMITLTFASVPIYSIFCKISGFGGTTQVASQASNQVGKRSIRVFFDSNTDSSLPWRFKPEQSELSVKTGENVLVFYSSENLASEATTGIAIYNVTPHKAGSYFSKIQCFCFEDQTLGPKEKVLMPVSFYIDPKIEQDPNMNDVTSITLSYSFFKKEIDAY